MCPQRIVQNSVYEVGNTLIEFDSESEARAWLRANDPGGEVLECQLREWRPAGTADRFGVPRATERAPHLRVVK
jgi:hypothetical protein